MGVGEWGSGSKLTELTTFFFLVRSERNFLDIFQGTSLVVQWLRFCAPNARVPGSIPSQGIRSCMLHLKIPCAVTKTSAAK